MSRQECPKCVQRVPLWMVTFADMVSLLMAMFVMIVALLPRGTLNQEIPAMIDSFNKGIGLFDGGNTFSKGKLADLGMTIQSLPSSTAGKKSQSDVDKVAALLKKETVAKEISIIPTKSGFSISLLGDLYFKPGSAELLPQAKTVLGKVGDLIVALQKAGRDNTIKVKGFSDSGVIAYDSKNFSNNLGLSSKRANSVVEFFWGVGISPTRQNKGKIYSKFQSVAYGEFQPLEDNVSPEQRAYNRRVDIEFLMDPDAY